MKTDPEERDAEWESNREEKNRAKDRHLRRELSRG